VHHLAVVLAADRPALSAGLQRRGIDTGVHYPIPCHRQTPYRGFCDHALPCAETLAGQVLSLPIFPHMSEEQIGAVCEALQACAEEHEHRGR
jgi:dTDP-4-amino-4,6-dideoxygalactose transaminase